MCLFAICVCLVVVCRCLFVYVCDYVMLLCLVFIDVLLFDVQLVVGYRVCLFVVFVVGVCLCLLSCCDV